MKYVRSQYDPEFFIAPKKDEYSRFTVYKVNIDPKNTHSIRYGEWPWYGYPRGVAFTFGSAATPCDPEGEFYAIVDIGPSKNTKIMSDGYHHIPNLLKKYSEEGIPLKP